MLKENIITSPENSINAILTRIANTLLINSSFTDNLGLLNGKTGISIFFYHYGRYTRNRIYEEYAGDLIDEIYEEISAHTPVNLSDGLTGIGWGIEYLVRNGFVQADTDEALSEIDSAVYRIRLNTPVLVNSYDNFFSYGHYYITRFCGHNGDDEDINSLIKKYHLIFMIDECERIIYNKNFQKNEADLLSLSQLNSITWFILECERLGIFPLKTCKILEGVTEYIKMIPSHSINSEEYRLLTALNDAFRNAAVDLGRDLIKESAFSKDNSFDNELDCFIKHTCQALIYQGYYPACYAKTDDLIELISDDEKWKILFNNLKGSDLGLNGLAGIGLGLIGAAMN